MSTSQSEEEEGGCSFNQFSFEINLFSFFNINYCIFLQKTYLGESSREQHLLTLPRAAYFRVESKQVIDFYQLHSVIKGIKC